LKIWSLHFSISHCIIMQIEKKRVRMIVYLFMNFAWKQNWFIMQRKQLDINCISHLHFHSEAVCSKSIRYIDLNKLYSSKRSLSLNIAYGKNDHTNTFEHYISSVRRSQSRWQTKQEINLLFVLNHICMILNLPNWTALEACSH
jgi:hypothetical protein